MFLLSGHHTEGHASLDQCKAGGKQLLILNVLKFLFSNGAYLCQQTHRDMKLCDRLQQNTLAAGDALLSSSGEGVELAELRSHSSLAGNEEQSTDVYFVLVQGHEDFLLLSFNPFNPFALGHNVHLICLAVPLKPVAKSVSPEPGAFLCLINTPKYSVY